MSRVILQLDSKLGHPLTFQQKLELEHDQRCQLQHDQRCQLQQ